ncbi:hypothetical protein NKH92_16450 [Mesorhizobium sp. M0871]|uniref:hypothetical protein n=1 Tax=unclassified Mesorhizobium TaxID=325217 RepID=UPI0033396014
MSRLLVSILGLINGVIALGLILAGIALGQVYMPNQANAVIFGAVAGLAVAAIFCGGLAALLLIESHLRVLADEMRERLRVEAWRAKQAKIAAKAEAKAAAKAAKTAAAAS